jgi:hypothetical protein
MEERNRIQVKDRLGSWVVAQGDVVSGETQNVLNPQHISTQEIGLQGYAVAVPTRYLEDWL